MSKAGSTSIHDGAESGTTTWFDRQATRAIAALAPRDFTERTDEEQHVVRTLLLALVIVTTTLLAFAALYATGTPAGSLICLVSATLALGCVAALRAGYVTLITNAFIGGSLLLINVFCLMTDGPESSNPIWAVALAIAVMMLFPLRLARWWCCAIVANQIVLLFCYQQGWYNTALLSSNATSPSAFALNFLLAPLVAGAVSFWSAHSVDKISARLGHARSVLGVVLDTVTTEFIMVDRHGRLTEAPRQRGIAEHIGIGDRFSDFLRPRAPDLCTRYELGLDALLDEFLPIALLLEQMPVEWSSPNRVFHATYHPIYDVPGKPWTRLAIALTDITENRERERHEQQRDIAARVFHLLQTDRGSLLDFVAESDRLLAQLNTEDPDNRWLRALHTLKGNAGVFSLDALAQTYHTAEHIALAGSREAALEMVNDAWSAWRTEFGELTNEASFDGVFIDPACFVEFQALLDSGASHEALLDAASTWSYQPIHRELERLASRAASIAKRVGKPAPTLRIHAPNIRVDRTRWRSLWAAMIHTVRNAVDHGIEHPNERRALNKPERGTLSLTAELDDTHLIMHVHDDGRGIDWPAVREKAAAIGLDINQQEHIDWLLADGVSTRRSVDEISGRGLGLSALADAVAALDGTLGVQSTLNEGCTWTLRVPRESMLSTEDRHATPSAVNRALAAAG